MKKHIPVEPRHIIIFYIELREKFVTNVIKDDIHDYPSKTSREIWQHFLPHGEGRWAKVMFKPEHIADFSHEYFWIRNNWAIASIEKSKKENKTPDPISLYAESFAKALEYIGYNYSSKISEKSGWIKKANDLYDQFKAAPPDISKYLPQSEEKVDSDAQIDASTHIISENFMHAIEPVRYGQLILNDFRLIAGLNDRCRFYFQLSDEEIRLPDDLILIRNEWKAVHEKKKDKKYVEDYPIHGITDIKHKLRVSDNTREYYIKTKKSSNYNRHAVSLSLDTKIPNENLTVREKYFKRLMEFPGDIYEDFLVSTFGVNLTIVTSDEKIVLQQKIPQFTLTEIGKLHVGLGVDLKLQGSEPIDIEQYAYDNLKTQYTIKESETEKLKFYTVAFGNAQCIYATFGYVKLKVPFEELERRLQLSGAGERFRIFAMPFNLDGMKKFIAEKEDRIVNQYALFGALTSLHLFTETSILQIEEAFSGDIWKDFSKKIAEDKIEFSLDDLRSM